MSGGGMTQGRELIVGATIIAAVLVLAGGTLWLKGTNFGQETTPVVVLVREIGQLTEGNSVKLRGVPIGKVTSVGLQPGGTLVRLGLEIDGDFNVEDTRTTGVVIAPESMFGDWQAEIVDRARFPQFEYYEVPPGELEGDTLVLGGYAIPDISRLTAAADEISQNLRRLTDRFDRAFTEETADQLRNMVANVEGMTTEIRSLIGQQAATFQVVGGDVARAANEISQASTQARVTLQTVDGIITRGSVDSILTNVRRTTGNVDRLTAQVERSTQGLDRTLARADSTFASAQRLAARVGSGEGTLGRLLVDTTLAARAENAMAQLDSLLADVKRNPRRYVRLSIF
ncbi:MAG: MCE family protein [Gemmatimonadetes bacterium]|nr:MCE family protein [Gemmatimonadota bacterium]